ncbi:erythropoietin isoform X2 [Alligator mississippiensis]|uniref:erythropoietin isoform X2 n=1 Tax=Alligator mississippiensis TaxID=8496 RepID=UPI000907489D|nr:erythropoietin isoform X2 [Alligator mississippiensis]
MTAPPRGHGALMGDAELDMGRLGLWTLLSMLLLMPGPVQAGAPRPMCDPRVLEMFIRETQDAEKAAAACGAACDLPDILMLPETKVNFNEWQQMSWPARVQEVWGGHTLLVTALCRARELVTEPGTRVTLERMHNVVRGVGQILRNHEAKPPPLAPPPGSPARSVLRLLGAQSNFLRGKVSLLLADACRGGGPT